MIKFIFLSTFLAIACAQHGGEEHHKEDHYIDYHGHPVYKYNYYVHDTKTNDNKKQYEERDGDVLKGFYSVVQPDHKIRNVHYTADKDGFHTKITYEDGDKLSSGPDGAFNIDKTHGGSEINNHVVGTYTHKEIKHEPQLIKHEPVPVKYESVHHQEIKHAPVVHQQIKHEPVQYQQIKYEPVQHKQISYTPVVHQQIKHEPVQQIKYEPVQQIKYEPIQHQEIKYLAPKVELKKEEPKKQSFGFEISHAKPEIKFEGFSGFEGFGKDEKLGGFEAFEGFGGFDSLNTFKGFEEYKTEENPKFNLKYTKLDSKPIIKQAEQRSDDFKSFDGYEEFSTPGFGLGYFNNKGKVGLGAFA